MKEPIRYIFILMAAWCMPVLLLAQADSLLVLSDTLPALAPRDSRIIVLSDSLHRAAGAELGITSEEAHAHRPLCLGDGLLSCTHRHPSR